MAERGSSRGGRGGHSGGRDQQKEKPKKDNILDLKKYVDKRLSVKFSGDRQISGVLKGHDALLNLVLDDVEEKMVDQDGNERTRPLGLVVVRGTLISLISPSDGSVVIENPFTE